MAILRSPVFPHILYTALTAVFDCVLLWFGCCIDSHTHTHIHVHIHTHTHTLTTHTHTHTHTLTQGVCAVIAESFERIHRSNLVGMGVVPLQFLEGQSTALLGLTGRESYSIEIPPDITPGQNLTVRVRDSL